MPSSVLSTAISDSTNAAILAVSEDRIAGFHEDPFSEIARLSGLPLDTVLPPEQGPRARSLHEATQEVPLIPVEKVHRIAVDE